MTPTLRCGATCSTRRRHTHRLPHHHTDLHTHGLRDPGLRHLLEHPGQRLHDPQRRANHRRRAKRTWRRGLLCAGLEPKLDRAVPDVFWHQGRRWRRRHCVRHATGSPGRCRCGRHGAIHGLRRVGAGVAIAPSVDVEFDTWQNTPASGSNANDPPDDHIGIMLNSATTTTTTLPCPWWTPPRPGQTSRTTDLVSIQWNAGTHTLSIYFDGNLRTTWTNDIVNMFLRTFWYCIWDFLPAFFYTSRASALPEAHSKQSSSKLIGLTLLRGVVLIFLITRVA